MTKRRTESGQSLVMFVLFLVVLMAAASVVIDLGYWYLTKRQAQATADSVALAAAADLPNADVALSDSSGYRSRNNWQGAVDLEVSSFNSDSDTITAGFVLRPESIESLQLSLDYWHIKVDGYVNFLGGGAP